MNAYRKKVPVKNSDTIPENEIRVRKATSVGAYLERVHELFNGEKQFKEIMIVGVGESITCVLALTELLKHKFTCIHQ